MYHGDRTHTAGVNQNTNYPEQFHYRIIKETEELHGIELWPIIAIVYKVACDLDAVTVCSLKGSSYIVETHWCWFVSVRHMYASVKRIRFACTWLGLLLSNSWQLTCQSVYIIM